MIELKKNLAISLKLLYQFPSKKTLASISER
ncbi:hypothetical protein LUG01_001984 [Campylobacter coli]|nr:hypothetical protein [Campylobacter coli]